MSIAGEPPRAKPEGTVCRYVPRCEEVAATHVWMESRLGLYLSDDICERHLPSACLLGFREGYPPSVEGGELRTPRDDLSEQPGADHAADVAP